MNTSEFGEIMRRANTIAFAKRMERASVDEIYAEAVRGINEHFAKEIDRLTTDIGRLQHVAGRLGCEDCRFFMERNNPDPAVVETCARTALGVGQEAPGHTDHPLRHYDRTCPACQKCGGSTT